MGFCYFDESIQQHAGFRNWGQSVIVFAAAQMT